MADVKMCGLTRAEDVRKAVELGAAFVGVIFAGGPRALRPPAARALLDGVPGSVARVGVFGAAPPDVIAREARDAGIEIVQLHADPTAEAVRAVRLCFSGPIWAAVRIAGDDLPRGVESLFSEADAVVLDARSDTGLGGTGLALPWRMLATRIRVIRGQSRLVLAGGLTPGNVARAIDALSPDIVDVSSGIETAPGIKDHSLMSAFVQAARSSSRAA